jgi:Ca2+-transporting ATPase
MITGDNVHARPIAFECGILNHDEDLNNKAVAEGEGFRNY